MKSMPKKLFPNLILIIEVKTRKTCQKTRVDMETQRGRRTGTLSSPPKKNKRWDTKKRCGNPKRGRKKPRGTKKQKEWKRRGRQPVWKIQKWNKNEKSSKIQKSGNLQKGCLEKPTRVRKTNWAENTDREERTHQWDGREKQKLQWKIKEGFKIKRS